MRVITGVARGIRLDTALGKEIVRPTTDRVKEAMFSGIQFDLFEANVLDLFAGSGQLGIEALSRGAQKCVFVDSYGKNKDVISGNLVKTKLFDQANVINQNATYYIKGCREIFDFIFLDPPYGSTVLDEVLEDIDKVMDENSKILCETKKRYKINYNQDKLELVKVYNYGNTDITVFKKKEV